jgi:ABC-type lipoprotein export system ATPase subunit
MADKGLVCRRLSYHHPGGVPVLDHLEACFPGGAMTLVTGPTGAGKSTLLHLLGGLLRPTGGLILADDQPVSRWRAGHRDRWRRCVGVAFQHMHLIHELTVLENILLPLIPQSLTWSGCLEQAGPLLAQMNLAELAQTPVGRLSGGQRQRTAVARAMVRQPRFLLLDEPTAFQDDDATRSLLALWMAMAAQGACVIVCSHDVRLISAAGIFTRVWRLDQGRILSISPGGGYPEADPDGGPEGGNPPT